MQDFSYLVEAIDIKIVKEIASADLQEEDKKALIAYSIARKIEGVILYMPKKTHRIVYAKILARYGFGIKTIQDLAAIRRSVAYQIKKEVQHDNQ